MNSAKSIHLHSCSRTAITSQCPSCDVPIANRIGLLVSTTLVKKHEDSVDIIEGSHSFLYDY